MKAVNLIPADQRRSSGAAGKSGGAAYVLLGGLAIVVVMVAMLTLTNRSVADKTAAATSLEAQADVATAKVGNLASYQQFNQVVKTRCGRRQNTRLDPHRMGQDLRAGQPRDPGRRLAHAARRRAARPARAAAPSACAARCQPGDRDRRLRPASRASRC